MGSQGKYALFLVVLSVTLMAGASDRFQATPTYPVGTYNASAVAVGDFNNDGVPDLVTNNPSILLGNGDGSFQSPNQFRGSGIMQPSIAVADFDGDGNLDVAVVDSYAFLNIFLGDGHGNLAAPVTYVVPGGTPENVVAGDFNGDGKPDIAVASASDVGLITVFLNQGNGTFGTPKSYQVGHGPSGTVIGDFNHDGHLDIAVACQGDQLVSVLLGKGDGTFRAPLNSYAGSNPTAIDIGDFNNDGTPDVVVVNSAGFSVLLGNGNGTFAAPMNDDYTTVQPLALKVVDVNRDGNLDVVVTGPTDHNQDQYPTYAMVFLGNGDGTFQNPSRYYDAIGATYLAAGDFNGDGNPDLAAPSYMPSSDSPSVVDVLLGNGDGTFRAGLDTNTDAPLGCSTGAAWLTLGDWNGDGKLDAAVVDFDSACAGALEVMGGTGDGTFQPLVSYLTFGPPTFVTTADFNQDGKPDLAVSNHLGGVQILLNDGTGGFNSIGQGLGLYSCPQAIAVADLNGDGKPDMAVSSPCTAQVEVMLGNGDGTFQQYVLYSALVSSNAVAIADFNGDGKLDLALAGQTSSGDFLVSILFGNGNGTFKAPQSFTMPSRPSFVATADLNSDGHADLIVADQDGISVFLGNGNGTFKSPIFYPVGSSSPSIVIADLNNDKRLDLAVVSGGSNSPPFACYVLFGNGDGTFQTPVFYQGSAFSVAVAAGDLNNDGAPDLAVLGEGSDQITAMLNTGGTIVRLTSSPNPSKVDQPVTFTATVQASLEGLPVPTGKIIFVSGDRKVTVPLNQGTADVRVSIPKRGSYEVRAEYSGNSDFLQNVSSILVQTVQ